MITKIALGKEWFKTLLSGKPHFVVGGQDNPYLYRWYLIPRNRRFNIYLHKFLRDDDDRALHDHPWWFVSLILKGGYFERVRHTVLRRDRFSVAFRPATHRHRVILFGDPLGRKGSMLDTGYHRSLKANMGILLPKRICALVRLRRPGRPRQCRPRLRIGAIE
jgi:hypothetical protein